MPYNPLMDPLAPDYMAYVQNFQPSLLSPAPLSLEQWLALRGVMANYTSPELGQQQQVYSPLPGTTQTIAESLANTIVGATPVPQGYEAYEGYSPQPGPTQTTLGTTPVIPPTGQTTPAPTTGGTNVTTDTTTTSGRQAAGSGAQTENIQPIPASTTTKNAWGTIPDSVRRKIINYADMDYGLLGQNKRSAFLTALNSGKVYGGSPRALMAPDEPYAGPNSISTDEMLAQLLYDHMIRNNINIADLNFDMIEGLNQNAINFNATERLNPTDPITQTTRPEQRPTTRAIDDLTPAPPPTTGTPPPPPPPTTGTPPPTTTPVAPPVDANYQALLKELADLRSRFSQTHMQPQQPGYPGQNPGMYPPPPNPWGGYGQMPGGFGAGGYNMPAIGGGLQGAYNWINQTPAWATNPMSSYFNYGYGPQQMQYSGANLLPWLMGGFNSQTPGGNTGGFFGGSQMRPPPYPTSYPMPQNPSRPSFSDWRRQNGSDFGGIRTMEVQLGKYPGIDARDEAEYERYLAAYPMPQNQGIQPAPAGSGVDDSYPVPRNMHIQPAPGGDTNNLWPPPGGNVVPIWKAPAA